MSMHFVFRKMHRRFYLPIEK